VTTDTIAGGEIETLMRVRQLDHWLHENRTTATEAISKALQPPDGLAGLLRAVAHLERPQVRGR
jgi:hypothetical protein